MWADHVGKAVVFSRLKSNDAHWPLNDYLDCRRTAFTPQHGLYIFFRFLFRLKNASNFAPNHFRRSIFSRKVYNLRNTIQKYSSFCKKSNEARQMCSTHFNDRQRQIHCFKELHVMFHRKQYHLLWFRHLFNVPGDCIRQNGGHQPNPITSAVIEL